jgi:protoporphyrinogen oxidase
MMKHIAVIGGGISGLTACYRLAANLRGRKDYTIYLITGLEDRQGGWLRSHRTVPDGFLFERAARSINCKPSNAHAFVQLVSCNFDHFDSRLLTLNRYEN